MNLPTARETLLWLLAPAFCAPATAQIAANPAPAGLRQTRLYAIASARVLDHVNRDDARAALKTWFDVLARQRGFLLDSKVDVADTVTEIRRRLESRSVDLIALTVPDYLELEGSHLAIPVLAHARGPQAKSLFSYLLLVNSSSSVSTIAGLRGKTVLTFSRAGANTGAAWVDVLLGKEKLGRAAAFFSSLTPTATSQACILPVFFGRADACVVDEINFDLAREMNPQLGCLRAIARSRPVLEGLIVVPVEQPPYRKELFDALLTLHQNPRGRQLLLVFKTDRLVPVAPGDLDAARELWLDYQRLPSAAGHPAGSMPPEAVRQED